MVGMPRPREEGSTEIRIKHQGKLPMHLSLTRERAREAERRAVASDTARPTSDTSRNGNGCGTHHDAQGLCQSTPNEPLSVKGDEK